MNRIDLKFKELKNDKKKAMIPFITAGDPDMDTTVELVLSMEKAGAGIVELGIPYSDPLADGPIIQASSIRALSKGIRIKDIMEGVKIIRKNSSIPLIYLVYYNSIFKYGVEKFIEDAHCAGIDGLIIPDLPIEEREDIMKIGDMYNVYLIPLVAPTSRDRIKKITSGAKGFIYCVSALGVTGIRQDFSTDIGKYMKTISGYSNLPKALGFGISGPEMAKRYKDVCEGIIVGSAIVRIIGESKSRDEIIGNVSEFVRGINDVL